VSVRANYFKLGLFVLGAMGAAIVVLLVVGSGRWFQPRITFETYFDESVQGLDIGSKVKYRGVVIGEVTKIGFTHVVYPSQSDRPLSERKRYVMVEAKLQPKLLGGRAASEITSPENAKLEVERGLRARLAPQGITGTNYLELDYVDPQKNPVLPIDWEPENFYIPSSRSTVLQFVNAASDLITRLHDLDVEGIVGNLNRLLVLTNERVGAIDTKVLAQRADRVLGKMETALDGAKLGKVSDEAVALLAELRESNAELRKTLGNPALQKLPEDAGATMARLRTLTEDPALPKTLQSMSRTLGRIDRILGGGEADLAATVENLRQITDNLRDLTEDTKRYPANVIFGGPPRPLEGQ
jgi:ABC-type transporter Mla subunit MlaD